MSRHMEVSRLRAYLERAHWPRLQMSLIVLMTGAIGFLASYLMLNTGLHAMGLRYPLAVGCAYLAFLALLWTWARSHCWARSRDPERNYLDFLDVDYPGSASCSGESSNGWQAGSAQSSGDQAATSFNHASSPYAPLRYPDSGTGSSNSDWSPFDAADDAAWVLIALAIAAGALLAIGWVIWIAPGLMAELLLDVVLAGGLYRRLRRIDAAHWLSTVWRRTAIPFVVVALMAALAGGVGARYAPGADSFGDVIATYQARIAR
ncbi:MAG: hypothetical protein ACREP7_02050 [Lysobacter sp.]